MMRLALGAGLGTNLEESCTFLINHSNPGDEIYVFGFSRGAYVSRPFSSVNGVVSTMKSRGIS
jgi:uncharacterized protein (DUF2235 family)